MAMLYDHALPGLLIEDQQATTRGGIQGRGLGVTEGKAFVSMTRRHIDKIRTQPIGAAIVNGISKFCGQNAETVVIIYGVGTLVEGRVDANQAALNQSFAGRVGGEGPIMVSYNPFIDYDTAAVPTDLGMMTFRSILGVEMPGFLALAHELVHALHRVTNTKKEGYCAGGALEEEAYTVGAGKYAGGKYTENAVRAEHNLGLRGFYMRAGDCS